MAALAAGATIDAAAKAGGVSEPDGASSVARNRLPVSDPRAKARVAGPGLAGSFQSGPRPQRTS